MAGSRPRADADKRALLVRETETGEGRPTVELADGKPAGEAEDTYALSASGSLGLAEKDLPPVMAGAVALGGVRR
jgi:hypothetical protein